MTLCSRSAFLTRRTKRTMFSDGPDPEAVTATSGETVEVCMAYGSMGGFSGPGASR